MNDEVVINQSLHFATVSVVDCTCPALSRDHTYVAIDDSIQHAMEYIKHYAPLQDNSVVGAIRAPPLVFTTLKRGGKTTFLLFLFHTLKDLGYAEPCSP